MLLGTLYLDPILVRRIFSAIALSPDNNADKEYQAGGYR
jgi:hypothetical protein